MPASNLNPLAMPFISTKKDEDRIDSPVHDKLQPTTSRVETTVANGSARGPVNYFPTAKGIWTNCAVAEPFPYNTDPISGQVLMKNQPLPEKRNENEKKQQGDEEKTARPVDINLVVRLPLILRLIIIYKITRARPYRLSTHNIIVHADCCTNNTKSQVQDVVHEDMKESIKNNNIPLKDKNAYSCGRVDFKTQVIKQGADARDQNSFLGPQTCLWFALSPLVREKLARRQNVEEDDISLRVSVTVFEGFPIRHLLNHN